MSSKIKSGHGLLYLSQIVVPKEKSNASSTSVERVSKSLLKWGFNLVLPVVCLTGEEERYSLLTGLSIYEAAQKAGLKQIWVLLISELQENIDGTLEELQLQLSLNERLILNEELEEFQKFLNEEETSSLKSISGIKDAYAKLIKDKRPFQSVEEMQKALGKKRVLNWFKSYEKLSDSTIN